MKYPVTLQKSSIYHVPFDIYEKDFTFIVNNEEIRANKIVADLISPKISKLHSNDPTIDEFSIFTETPGDFSKVLNLVKFGRIEYSITEIQYFSEILQQLESEIKFIINEDEEITTDNVVDLINQHEKWLFFFSEYLSKEIDFLSENFTSVDIENIKTLSHDVLVLVLGNSKLRLDNEDYLLEVVNELYTKDKNNSDLYEFVYFTNVETQTIEKFLQIFDINDISATMWKSLSKRFKLKLENDYQKETDFSRYKNRVFNCPFNGEDFRGIIRYIKEQIGINSIKITAEKEDFTSLIKYNDIYDYYSSSYQKLQNPSICFEFKNHRVSPTHYTLRTNSDCEGSPHIKSWIVEGSNDSISWTEIDKKDSCSLMNGRNEIHTFATKYSDQKGFKFIRIKQIANWRNNNDLSLTAVEFYGNLISVD